MVKGWMTRQDYIKATSAIVNDSAMGTTVEIQAKSDEIEPISLETELTFRPCNLTLPIRKMVLLDEEQIVDLDIALTYYRSKAKKSRDMYHRTKLDKYRVQADEWMRKYHDLKNF